VLAVLVVVAAGVIAGGLGTAAAVRWPGLDPGAPRLRRRAIRHGVEHHPGIRNVLRRRLDPGAVTGLLLTVAIAVLVGSIVAVGLLLAMVTSETGLQRSDLPVTQWAAEQSNLFAADILRLISRLGGTGTAVAVTAVLAVVELRRRPSWSVPTFLVLAVGGQFALVNVIKALIERARPDVSQLTGFAGASFPSGHAAAAATVWAVAALILSRGWDRLATVLPGAAIGIAVSVAATRVMLGVHWFTDVLAGLLVGWGWFVLCSIAFGGRILHFGAPVEVAEAVAAED
jgi:membrane-associated phospholipid phosphatase